jgi:site-specific DNA-methyltransferase (adenine-specific)
MSELNGCTASILNIPACERVPFSNVYNEDCLPQLWATPDDYYDLAIIDPPYGINVAERGKVGGNKPFGRKTNYGAKNSRRRTIESKNYGAQDWDKEPPSPEFFLQLLRVSKNTIIFGANHFISRIPAHMQDSSCWLVWDKENSGNFADCELAWTSFPTAVRKIKFKWNGMLQGNMKNKEERIHPTQKPVYLYRAILQQYAKPGDKILDTHMGSQSSRIAAFMLGYDYTGFEINKEHFDKGNKRFIEQTSQMPIFERGH